MSLTLVEIEAQLKRRVVEYPRARWGRKQTDDWDRRTRFIYDTLAWDDLRAQIAGLDRPLADYAVHRWFNFWSARAVEMAFCARPGVQANRDAKDRLVDFCIDGIPFDHKTSVFPAQYDRPFEQARRDKRHLIRWLYDRQSTQGRHHLENRLFILLYAHDGAHWRLRAEVSALAQLIAAYVDGFSPPHLIRLSFDDHQVLSDVLWFVQ
ncbi:MAG: hypothetical protein JW934_22015 [Anaerolineae bacterium]|nr:hypothetical protein [Anaerolineae bacterium]